MPALRRRISRPTILAGIPALLVCSIATAGATEVPDFLMTWNAPGLGGATEYNWNQHGSVSDFGEWAVPGTDPRFGWQYTGSLSGPQDAWDLEWNCVFNDGSTGGAASGGAAPFVTANMVVTNNSATTETFSLLMTLPVAKTYITPQIAGSVVGTVTDLTGDDAVVNAVTSSSIYEARIDTVEETDLLIGTSQNAGGGFLSAPVGPDDFGLGSSAFASQNVDSSIAIYLEFELSAGDAASFTAIFEIVPAPGALMMMAAAGLVGSRRRRQA